MIKNSGLVFRDIRNMRRNQTMLAHSTGKELITSVKQLKNIRSTKQIDLTTFMENKNQKIKNIDEKLEIHQSEISKNNQIIEELSENFVNLKQHLDKQKQATASEEKKNKLLRDEIERTNKILKTKNTRIDQCNKRIGDLEKQVQNFKSLASKNEQYVKTIANLRGKIGNFEESIADLQHTVTAKDREILKYKQKIGSLEQLRGKQEEYNAQILSKQNLITTLRAAIHELNSQKNRQIEEKKSLSLNFEKCNYEITALKQANYNQTKVIADLEKKNHQILDNLSKVQKQSKQWNNRLKSQETAEAKLKSQLEEVRSKYDELVSQSTEKNKQIHKKDVKVDKMQQKIKELETVMGQSYKQKEKLRSFQEKVEILKRRLSTLQNLYHTMTPQIQCPFGHQLHNPVTIIPCGHNYCLGCKKGYAKQCMQCSGKLKIQAVYRNQLMDDIIGMVGGVKQIIEILK